MADVPRVLGWRHRPLSMRTIRPVIEESLVLALLPFMIAAPLYAATPSIPDAKRILQGMKAALEPPRPSLRELEIVLHDPQGAETRWIARQARRPGPDGERMAMVLVSPVEIAGAAVLITEQPNGPDVQWEYIPFVRRVRRIVPAGAFQPFLGTDFTYADLGFVPLARRSLKLIGTTTMPDGTHAYQVEETPDDNWYYSRILDWVDVDTLLPLRREFYSLANDLWKTEVFDAVTRVQGVPTPIIVRMEDRLDGGNTELRVLRVRYDADIPEKIFEPAGLPTLLDQPVWLANDEARAPH